MVLVWEVIELIKPFLENSYFRFLAEESGGVG